jgi:hypothetical protein
VALSKLRLLYEPLTVVLTPFRCCRIQARSSCGGCHAAHRQDAPGSEHIQHRDPRPYGLYGQCDEGRGRLENGGRLLDALPVRQGERSGEPVTAGAGKQREVSQMSAIVSTADNRSQLLCSSPVFSVFEITLPSNLGCRHSNSTSRSKRESCCRLHLPYMVGVEFDFANLSAGFSIFLWGVAFLSEATMVFRALANCNLVPSGVVWKSAVELSFIHSAVYELAKVRFTRGKVWELATCVLGLQQYKGVIATRLHTCQPCVLNSD